ncbi:MAG: hybrid sensor histidine kinase/response regulator [Verrucomicrobiota bacterium]
MDEKKNHMTTQNPIDYKKFAILYVDDEEMSLKYFALAFEDQFRILTASNAKDGLKLLEEHKDDIGLLMTDQRMPGEKGVWLLEKARQLQPRMIRILATAYADMDAAIAAVNSGAIYKYVTKPWDPPHLEQTLKRGLEFFVVKQERDRLLKEKVSVLRNMMIAEHIVRLGLLAAGMSHHIRNSLVAVKTFLDLAPTKMQEEKSEETVRNPEFWKEYHQNVQKQIEKINNMLKDLWAASEKPSFEFNDSVRLHEVLATVIKQLEPSFAAKDIRVQNNIPDSLPPLIVDGTKFHRLFELLLKDEIVSLPAGSTVQLSASQRNGDIRVEVSDDGPGISKESLQLVFDPFVLRTDTPMEYGINLMACFFIVHHHGGSITAHSEGKGTTFDLRLPVNPNQPPGSQEDEQFLQKVVFNNELWEKLTTLE